MATYRIVRFYQDPSMKDEVQAEGLTLAEVQAHCEDPQSTSRTCTDDEGIRHTERYGAWFDGYFEE